jgi:hypothetical protein
MSPHREMSPRAFAIWMVVLGAYFAAAFRLTFAATTYSPHYTIDSAVLVRAPAPAVRVAITFKAPPGDAKEVEVGIWAPDGPPYHMQEVPWSRLAELDRDARTSPQAPPPSGTHAVFTVPLDAENLVRLQKRADGRPFELQFHWGGSRYLRIPIAE